MGFEDKKRYAIGIHVGFLGAVVLLCNGSPVCAVAEERLSRVKNDKGYVRALEYVLDAAKITLLDVETIACDSEDVSAYLRTVGYDGNVIFCDDKRLIFAKAAFFASGYDTALAIVNDFSGLFFFSAKGREIRPLAEISIKSSDNYRDVTGKLGFDENGETGKTMALAAYGNEKKGGKIAFDAQRMFENDFVEQVLKIKDKYNFDKIVMAGIMALNCVANGKLLIGSSNIKSNIFVLPCAGEDGLAMGLAYIAAGRQAKSLNTVYLGRKYSFSPILLNNRGLSLVACQDGAFAEAARMIYEGKIVCCFQNSSEFGPRALGNRSILANPALPTSAKEKLDSIKSRESFRPYAPSVLEECADEFFIMRGLKTSPFMLFGVEVKEEKKDSIKGVCHIDGTSRIQTVNVKQNPTYYRLIKRYAEISGIPMLLNTSFNRAGEPLVETLEDAVRCFMATEADALMIQDTLWVKKM